MKMSKLNSKLPILAIFCLMFFGVACKKDNKTPSSTDNSNANTLSANGASTDNAYDDVFSIAVQTGNENGVNSISPVHSGGVTVNSIDTRANQVADGYYCAHVTLTTTPVDTFPATLVVDFGADGCNQSTDGVMRSGKITYVFSARFRNPGATITATFDNYKANGYQLSGTYKITNNSSLANGIAWNTTVTDGSIIYPNDTTYAFAGTKTVTQTGGIGSLDLATWVFNVTGGYTISKADGETLSATVTTPLVKKWTCKNVVSGVASFVYQGNGVSVNGTFDYGDGTCDNQATVKIGSATATVTLF